MSNVRISIYKSWEYHMLLQPIFTLTFMCCKKIFFQIAAKTSVKWSCLITAASQTYFRDTSSTFHFYVCSKSPNVWGCCELTRVGFYLCRSSTISWETNEASAGSVSTEWGLPTPPAIEGADICNNLDALLLLSWKTACREQRGVCLGPLILLLAISR